MDLSTRYMGLALRNPLVASASPLSNTVDGVRQLAGAGVGAVVLYSLFEEQLRQEMAENARLAEAGTEVFAESLSYFPAEVEEDSVAEAAAPRRYLSLLERAVAAVDVPVIGSLNGVTTGGWTSYARAMQDAGAAAIELNIYYIPGDPRTSGRDVEQRHIDVLGRVKAAVTVPVAVKLSPHFSSVGEMALRLDEAGADGLVLFNRFLQPDIDPETLAVLPAVDLSSPAEARLPRTWISLLRKHLRASLAATTGVEGPQDVVKYLLAGADVVMTASALMRHGPEHAAALLDECLDLLFACERQRFEVPIVEDHELEIAELAMAGIVRALDLELRGVERLHEVRFGSLGVLGKVEHAGTPEHDGLRDVDVGIEIGRFDGEREIQRAGCREAGVDMHFVRSFLERDRSIAQHLAFGADLHSSTRGLRRDDCKVDGKMLAGEGEGGHAHGLDSQGGLGASAQSERVDGDTEVPRLPGRAGDAARVLLAVGHEDDARDQTGR